MGSAIRLGSAIIGLVALSCLAAACSGARSRSIVALGDSVPHGTNCGCTPYPPLSADYLAAAIHQVLDSKAAHRREIPVALDTALDRADAAAVALQLREGMATPIGRSFSSGQDLSGGQWQRLALARGMMRDLPLLLVLDEPTASLDAITEAALFDRYLAARVLVRDSGAITLIVSHRFSTVRTADLIVVIDQGRVAAVGDHASLIQAGGLYADLYEIQARAYRCAGRVAEPAHPAASR